MIILDLGCNNVTVELDVNDLRWLIAAARNGNTMALGYGMKPDACGYAYGVPAAESAKMFDHYYNLFAALEHEVDNSDDDDEPDADAQPGAQEADAPTGVGTAAADTKGGA